MVAASGSVSLIEQNARSLLANLAAFRSWCGAADVAAAEALVFTDAAPAGQALPYAELYLDPDGEGFEMLVAGGGKEMVYDRRGQVRLLLYQEVAAEHQASITDAERVFKNSLGAIIDELADLSGSGDASEPLTVTRLWLYGPWRFDEDFEEQALGQVQVAGLVLEWEY